MRDRRDGKESHDEADFYQTEPCFNLRCRAEQGWAWNSSILDLAKAPGTWFDVAESHPSSMVRSQVADQLADHHRISGACLVMTKTSFSLAAKPAI